MFKTNFFQGYTIPLDKRLAADGRGLQDPHINDKFAKLAEALYIADRKVEVNTKIMYFNVHLCCCLELMLLLASVGNAVKNAQKTYSRISDHVKRYEQYISTIFQFVVFKLLYVESHCVCVTI